jgi:glycosyltransferase involved in cell wall biosynthesis
MIPKLIHQLWIGSKPAPRLHMETWKTKNPDYEYILWTEDEFDRRGMQFTCFEQINDISELVGKVDIMRWEILYKYGGIFIDADSICLEPLDPEIFLTKMGFASYESETERGTLVANGTMGFVPQHPLCGDIIKWIRESNEFKQFISQYRAWYSVGPGLLTRFLDTGNYRDTMTIFPSHFFLPRHFTGHVYDGHKKVYAYQEWGSTNDSYGNMQSLEIPADLLEPPQWISILVSSYNTARRHIRECLDSIREQLGRHIGFEVVWVNDGSDPSYTDILEKELRRFLRLSRFCKVAYYKMHENVGIAECLRRGVEWCSHEIIAKMDSDDVMYAHRIVTQYSYMMSNPNVPIVGGGIRVFKEGQTGPMPGRTVIHPTITLEEFQNAPKSWVMNHPTVMMRKSAVLKVGNYRDVYDAFGIEHDNGGAKTISEDFDLEIRLLKEYGILVNMEMPLVMYRIHPNQITYGGLIENSENQQQIIKSIISSIH